MSFLKGKNLDLKYFIFRTNALLMYRESLKLTSKMIDKQSINDLKNFIRSEFELNRNITDNKKLEFLQATGRKKINSFKENIEMTK